MKSVMKKCGKAAVAVIVLTAAAVFAGAGKKEVSAQVFYGVEVDAQGNIYYYEDGVRSDTYTGMATDIDTQKRYWFDEGTAARDKQVYDPASDAWYWFDADGTMAAGKDVYIPESNENRAAGKWVRYDSYGRMTKGIDYRYGGVYYFDQITGEMKKGFAYIPQWDTWVYCDDITGQMRQGESYINGEWYRFGRKTYYNGTYYSVGMNYGFYMDDNENAYYYDAVTGIMVKGEFCIDGSWYYADEITGTLASGESYHNGAWYYYSEYNYDMQKGVVYHDGHEYYYDSVTGVMRYGQVEHDGGMYYYDSVTGIRIAAPISPEDEEHMNLAYAKECLRLQNEIRVQNGLPELAWNDELYNSIKIRGVELAESFSHTRPDGQSCFSAITVDYWVAGENIAAGYGTPSDVTTGWYNSQGHRENMLYSNFTSAAVVCYKHYWVTVFIG